MADPSDLAVGGVMAYAAKPLIEGLTKTATDLFMRVVGPSADEVGKALGSRTRKVMRINEVLEASQEQIAAAGLEANPIEDKLLFPLMEGIAVEDNEDLKRCWASLLANASTESNAVQVKFVSMLAELEPKEASLLNALYEKRCSMSSYLQFDPNATLTESLEWEGVRIDMELSGTFWATRRQDDADYQLAVFALFRLGVLGRIETNATPERPHRAFGVRINRLGMLFVKACRPPEPKS